MPVKHPEDFTFSIGGLDLCLIKTPLSQDPDNLHPHPTVCESQGQTKVGREGYWEQAPSPQLGLFFPSEKSVVERGSNTNIGRYTVENKDFQIIWYLYLTPPTFTLGKKKCPGFERAKSKMDTLLQIVIYVDFRFNSGKYSRIYLEKHSKLASYYT